MPIYEYQGQQYEMAEEDPLKAKSKILNYLKQSAPKEPPKERTYGEATQDIGASLISGFGGLAALPSQLGRLAGMEGDLPLEETSKSIKKYGESLKSGTLKEKEKARDALIQEAEAKGVLQQAWVAFKETGKDPALFTSFLAEMLPNLIPGTAVGKGLKLAGAGTKAMLAGNIGTNAVMQGADVSSGAYEEALKYLLDKNVPIEEAKKQALDIARQVAVGAGGISAAAQFIPGARGIEKSLLGIKGTKGRLASATGTGFGESVGEVIEEGGGNVLSNLALQQINPEQSLTEGLGQTIGMAALGGAGIGVPAGALRGRERVETPKTELTTEEDKQKEILETNDPDKLAELAKEEIQSRLNSLLGDINPPQIPVIEPTQTEPPSAFATKDEIIPEFTAPNVQEKIAALKADNERIQNKLNNKEYPNSKATKNAEAKLARQQIEIDTLLKGEQNVGRDDSGTIGDGAPVPPQTPSETTTSDTTVAPTGGLGGDIPTETKPGVGEKTQSSALTTDEIETPFVAPIVKKPTKQKTLEEELEDQVEAYFAEESEEETTERLAKAPRTQTAENQQRQAKTRQRDTIVKEIKADKTRSPAQKDTEMHMQSYMVAAGNKIRTALDYLAYDMFSGEAYNANSNAPFTGGKAAKAFYGTLSAGDKKYVDNKVSFLKNQDKRLNRYSGEGKDKAEAETISYDRSIELANDPDAQFSPAELKILDRRNKKIIAENKAGVSKLDVVKEGTGGATPKFMVAVLRGDIRGALKEIIADNTGAFTRLDKLIADRLLKSKTLPALNVVKNLKHSGIYDARTDVATIREDSINSHVFLHEVLHGFTASFVQLNKNNPVVKDLQRLFDYVLQNNPELKSEYAFKDGQLKEFISEVFSNRELQLKLDKIPYRRGNVFSDFAKKVLQILNIPVNDTYSVLAQALISTESIIAQGRDFQNITDFSFAKDFDSVSPLEAVEEVKVPKSEADKKAEFAAKNIVDVDMDSSKEELEKAGYVLGEKEKPRSIKEATKFFTTREGRERLVQKLQNRAYPILAWQNNNNKAGLTKYGKNDMNNIADWLTLAASKAKNNFTKEIQPHYESLETNLNDLAKSLGKNTEETLQFMSLVIEGLHEPERRMVKYLLSVPLKAEAHARRVEILEFLDKNTLSKAQAESLRNKLNQIVFETDANGSIIRDAKGDPKPNLSNVNEFGEYKDKPSGGKKPIAFDSIYYNVIGVAPEAIKRRIEQYNKHPQKDKIDAVLKDVKDINSGTVKLNKMSNYFSDPVDNRVNFYGFNYYAPFKGKNSFKTDSEVDVDIDPQEKISRTLQTGEMAMDGRITRSNNPILQTLSEAAQAAARAGRGVELTQSIKNSVKPSKLNPNGQGLIQGNVIDRIEFNDRDISKLEKHKASERVVFHYNKDGSIDIIEINELPLMRSIKGTYSQNNIFVEVANRFTSGLGQMHTRYNPKFAPLNFVRDILTNTWAIGAEMGIAKGAKFLSTVSSQLILNNSMGKAAKIASLYGKGNINAINALKDKPGYKELVEYIEEGGMVEYMQSLSLKSNFQQLQRELGRNKILKTKDQVERLLDTWTNMFELASRSAAYKVVKQEYINDKMSSKDAAVKAAAYVKNLANFEQVGEMGKVLGGFYMFFRPSMTGAVRAIEAVSPAFRNVDKVVEELPAHIYGNEQAREKFREEYTTRKRNATIMTMGLIGLGMATYTLSRLSSPEDDDGRNEVDTDNIDLWTRFLRIPISKELTGLEKNTVFQIPWGFGLGAFAAMGAQFAAVLHGNTSLLHAIGNITTQISLDSFVPLPVSRMDATETPIAWLVDSVTPSFGRPLVEFVMNKNGLGHDIRNEAASRKLGDAYTGGDNIPEIYKDAAAYMAEETLGAINVSPNVLYFFANSYLDGISVVAQQAYGMHDLATDRKDFDPKTDLLILSSFIGTKSSVDSREFSKVSKQIEKIQEKLNMFKERAPEAYVEYVTQNPFSEVVVESYNKQVNGELRTLRAEANKIRTERNYTPAERKDLLQANLMVQNIIKRNMIEEFKVFGIEP